MPKNKKRKNPLWFFRFLSFVIGDTYINGFEHARNLADADYDVHRAYLSDAPVKPYNREFYRDLYVDHDGNDDDSYESPILNDYDYR